MALKAKKPKQTPPRKRKILVFAGQKVGKTWFSLDFPKCYYIDAEEGATPNNYQEKLEKSGGVYLSYGDGANDFDFVLDQLKELATTKHDFQTVAIGSITKLFQTVIADEEIRLDEAGKKDEFGTSRKPAVRKMRQLVQWIQRVDMNVVLESHEVAKWGKVNGIREEVGVKPDCWDKLLYELDLVLNIKKAGPERIMIPTDSRLEEFPEYQSFPCSYEEFANRAGREGLEGIVKPIELVTPEQLTELEKLLEIMNITEKETKSILKKGKASDWNELTTEHAAKTIEWMKGKIA